jgi:hypothetical protein
MSETPSFWHKAVWRLARTPGIHLIKAGRRWGEREQLVQRSLLARQLTLSERGLRFVEELRESGFCRIDGVVDPGLLDAVGKAGSEKLRRADPATQAKNVHHKEFWTRLLDEDKIGGSLPTDNPFVAFAVQPAVLALLGRFYGEIPLLDDVLLTLSRPTGKALALSQLWHRDYDDTRTVKMFIYLTDVASSEDGPFTFIDGPSSDRLGTSLRSWRDDDEIARRAPAGAAREMVASRLSVFMVETSRCLHMGSRVAPGHERLLYTASYISIPRLYPEPPSRFKAVGGEPEPVHWLLSPSGACA